MIIETHCHLNDERLLCDADRIVGNFEGDNIECAICVGYDIPSSECAVALADKYPKVYSAIGVHPHDATTLDDKACDVLRGLAKDDKVVAIGEIGLDYYYDLSPREVQKDAFKKQIVLAHELKLPLILHVRDAYEDTRQMLVEMKDYLTNGVLLHCYSGSSEMVKVFDKFDCYYAFGGAITFKNAKHNLEALATVPKDRLLLETDCPYMTPVPYRGKTNEPKYISLVASKMSQVLEMPVEEIEKITTNNAKRLFNRIK